MRTVHMNLGEKSYDLLIDRGILKRAGDEIKSVYKGKRIAVIADRLVAELYYEELRQSLENAGFHPSVLTFSPGESSKSLETAEQLYHQLVEIGLQRSDLIIALGGGVTGDLAGFVASTYLRGVPFVQIPTTLLAQIDSSIGGKVGVNLGLGKNLIGSFYQPKMVLIDPDVLSTLDEKYVKDGIGETLKYVYIYNHGLLDLVEKAGTISELMGCIDDVIAISCEAKRHFVEEDEYDKGLRMILNFGHTVGHGIEKYFDYLKYTHGHAVALGMYIISQRAFDQGIIKNPIHENIKVYLERFGLYDEVEYDAEVMASILGRDKKVLTDKLNLILVDEIGMPVIYPIDMEQIIDFV